MADKELTVFVVDVGQHMAVKRKGTNESELEYATRYMKDVVCSKIIKGRKTDLVSLISVDSEITNNDSDVKQVSVDFDIQQPLYEHLQKFDLKPNLTHFKEGETDGIVRALLLSIQNVIKFVGKKKYKKNIVLITNSKSRPELDKEFGDAIAQLVVENGIQLVLIGADFDLPTQIEEHQENIQVWKLLFEALPGSTLLTGKEANNLIEYPNPKLVRPVKVFSGEFRIGANILSQEFSPKDDYACVCFEVEGYPATKVDSPPSRETFGLDDKDEVQKVTVSTDYEIHLYADDGYNEKELEQSGEEEFAKVQYDIQPVDKSELTKGYKYGKSTVILTPALEEKRIYKTEPGLDIRGVVHEDKLPRCYLTSEAVFIVGKKNSQNDSTSLAAIVDALSDLSLFAIARYVQKRNAEVQMVALVPVYLHKGDAFSRKRKHGDNSLTDTRALILTRLPFFEDEKIAVFPPLTKVYTSSGKVIKESHRFLPSREAIETMETLVNQLDLDNYNAINTDFEGKKRIFNPLVSGSLLPVSETKGEHDNLVKLSTGIHRTNQVLKSIALNGSTYSGGLENYCKSNDIIPPFEGRLYQDTLPNPKLMEDAREQLKTLSDLLNVKEAPKKENRSVRKAVDEMLADNFDDDEEGFSLEDLLRWGTR